MDLVKKNEIKAPLCFWNVEDSYTSNGCGTDKTAKVIPNRIFGCSILLACIIHDYMYEIAEPKHKQKEIADRVFLENMQELIIRYGGFWKFLRLKIARKYYLAVKHFGGWAFWKNKTKEIEL